MKQKVKQDYSVDEPVYVEPVCNESVSDDNDLNIETVR